MKRSIFFLILLPLIGFSQDIDFSSIPHLRTKATYTTEVIPDRIVLSIILSESNSKGKISVEKLESNLKSVLISNNVDLPTQLKLISLSSNFRNHFLKKTDVQKAKIYELDVYSAKEAGKILRDLEKYQISNVKLLNTEYVKLEELKIELKAKAILKAKKQADGMAKALNQKLGKAIFISDIDTDNPFFRERNIGSNTISYRQKQEDIDFDKIKVRATVIVYFQLD